MDIFDSFVEPSTPLPPPQGVHNSGYSPSPLGWILSRRARVSIDYRKYCMYST